MDVWFTVAGLILGFWGAIPTIILIRERVTGTRALRRMLALGSQKQIEILVTSSITNISKVGPSDEARRAIRSLVPSGDLAGVAELSVMLAKAYPGKSFVVKPSTSAPANPNADVFVIGGPIHNSYAATFIEGRKATAGINSELIFDADHRFIKFGNVEYGPDLDLQFENNVPKLDYGLVMLTRIRRNLTSSRVLLAAGLTTYGTHAAADFAAHELVSYVRKNRLGRSPNVCVLVKAKIVNGKPFDLEAVAYLSGALLPS